MNELTPPDWMEENTAAEIVSPARQERGHNPFEASKSEHINLGTVAVESQRAAAEVQGRMIVAKQWPRDAATAYARTMDACRRKGLADCAIYTYKRGSQNVSGPSIRFAEELARNWGNIEYGLRELSRRPGESEMQAFAWDLETNTLSVQNFTVAHKRDTKGGGYALKDERDIYEVTANMGARRLRARILAILPPELIDDAVAECKRTIAQGGKESLADRIRKMTQGMLRVNVTVEMLAERLGHPIDQTNTDELVELQGIYTSIKDGQTKVSDWFGASAAKSTPAKLPENADAFERAAHGEQS
ncbi:hypothetical protein [Komagataeibacter europaeus]|uniref:hypothetical protein n=1 Tax=Komagataeibacter europaeus TaxID=33995 RepID=UPI000237DEB8|nr:hypothetical protein [Komagataeibacter europaeus]